MQAFRSIVLLGAAAVIAAGCQTASSETSATTAGTFAPLVTTSTTTVQTTTATSPTTTTSSTTTTTIPVPECSVQSIGADDDFYRKTCDQNGIAIVAAESVDDAALEAAAARMAGLFAERPELADAVAGAIDHVAIIGANERITDLPEFEDLYFVLPGTDWNRLGRSFPGSEEIPIAAGAEENLLCLDEDHYHGEDMFLRDFGWTIRRFGLASVEPGIDEAIEDAYNHAIAADLWRHTIAEVNSDQYWAEGVQSFFDANNEAKDDTDEIHNFVDTRDELHTYDPFLYQVLVDVFGEATWRPECPAE
ncbi:MAG TPA: hypothetical protein VFD97_06945 [Acidimicrobiia bacterium]|nr:hypothetical protein [Acidimicrobiia bacterium]